MVIIPKARDMGGCNIAGADYNTWVAGVRLLTSVTPNTLRHCGMTTPWM